MREEEDITEEPFNWLSINLLLSYDANINIPNLFGETPSDLTNNVVVQIFDDHSEGIFRANSDPSLSF